MGRRGLLTRPKVIWLVARSPGLSPDLSVSELLVLTRLQTALTAGLSGVKWSLCNTPHPLRGLPAGSRLAELPAITAVHVLSRLVSLFLCVSCDLH